MKLYIDKVLYKILLLILSVCTLGSCQDDFLEVIPKGQLIAEKVVDYDQMFYNLRLINISTANAQVPLSPEILAFEPYFSNEALRTQRLYRWEGLVYDDEENAGELENTMENLYIYNKIINEVLEATEGTEQKKLSLQAEAKAGRAWVYFLLVNYYGMPYNEETSSTDLGFPIITEADLTGTDFSRATVEENYQFIVQDLTEAIPNLPTNVESRFRFTQAAGKALLGRVYTFMGRFEEAHPMLNDALDQMGNMGIDVRLTDYNAGEQSNNLRVDTYPEILYGKQFNNSWASPYSVGSIAVKPEVMELYQETDLRFQLLYESTARDGKEYPVEGAYRKTVSSNTFFGVGVPEIYLFDAEVKCRLNDLAGAVEVLEDFRSHRMPPENAAVPADIASNREALLQFIFDERLREFAAQGFHWFDIRRLTVDPDIPTPVSDYTHTVYNADGSVKGEYQLTQERLVLRFPETVMDQNPNLINND
ncbi:RagB/SusD family nutrient uptake outer membrane protein [Autumnicola musiva]|uniref:RagB/SusD family nutrient uptake outer membrane protein n=1 Tax=Autumnicola musiva TaxID=3075589 RepID=A0ABU3D9D5_9FLAO|nr:RagB/SusD family nutrient uptake outer membrane protein [Zunongwangia sp. F117]MDT0677959.1 RagB/SusD family nutrient uptake outer membrane protein [Zunongwangia sp. F117]